MKTIRDHHTLVRLIKQHMRPGTVIITEGWRGYVNLSHQSSRILSRGRESLTEFCKPRHRCSHRGGGGIRYQVPDITLVGGQWRNVTFWCPLLLFCRPPQIFYCLQKKKKKGRHFFSFFSVFLIGFLPPWTFLYPQIFFSRLPNA